MQPAAWEGGVAHDRAMGKVDWVVVLCGRQALPAKRGGGDGMVLFCFGACERARERQERVRVSARKSA